MIPLYKLIKAKQLAQKSSKIFFLLFDTVDLVIFARLNQLN